MIGRQMGRTWAQWAGALARQGSQALSGHMESRSEGSLRLAQGLLLVPQLLLLHRAVLLERGLDTLRVRCVAVPVLRHLERNGECV